jgi:hypothetical protein
MKKLSLLLLFFTIAYFTFAQTQVILTSEKTQANILNNTDQELVFTNVLEGFSVATAKTKDGMYSRIIVPKYFPNNKIGYPELPVMTKLIEVPQNAEFEIKILSYDEQIINLNEYGAELPLVPNQPSLFKNQDPASVPFEKNERIYTEKEYYETELVSVNNLSKMRGIQVAQIIISPFSYDVESNVLTIKNNIEIEITYKNADLVKTSQLKIDKYSPAFDGAYNKLWNYLAPANKDALSQYPIKYVIISDRMFETELVDFIAWKTIKGFNVDIAYTDEIGTSTTEIKAYIQGLYDAGTTEAPAPTFVLFVGDVTQIPAFPCSGHVSDMYYCEFDGGGDYIPEIYFGRFSATNVAQLQPQIEKTLMFEEYTFPDPSYLAEVVLVAGDDASFGPTHANGQINYAHNYYFNEEHGVTDYTYLYPESGSSSAAIISDISDGVGFVNYTAHCGSNGWGGPSFTTSDIPGLENDDEYFFSIGNCCLSNKFDDDECFGEALLRTSKKGAVVHIGGSNSTLWDEDFYWSAGLASSITATTSYEESGQACYDHMFHENDEDPYTTAYQMTYIGNMSVSASTSSSKQYYWEIYHVMGDPSLMPYVGVPDEVEASYLSTLPIGMSSLTVTTEENAYVAISIDGVLLDAKLADASGVVVLEFDPLSSIVTADVVVTKQFRAPNINEVMVIPNDNDYDAMLQTISVPTSMVHISEATLSPQVTILNLGLLNLTNVTVGYTLNGGTAIEEEWTGDLASLESAIVTFDEITLAAGDNTIVAYVSSPNGETDEYPDNDEATKDVLVYAGNAKLTEALSPETILCNSNTFVPQVILKNLDTYALTSATITYECGAISEDFEWTGSLAQNETTTISFSENTFPAGNNTITYSIISINEGENYSTSGTSIIVEFLIVENGSSYELNLLTDKYGEETTWELVEDLTSNILYSGGPFASDTEAHYITEFCLGPGCYTFTIFDSWGDGMAPWFGNQGSVTITDLSSSTVVYSLAGDGFEEDASYKFCIEDIACPADMAVDLADAPFTLTGGIPAGGTYTGTAITDGSFDPSTAGIGTHTITYHYMFEGSEELTCEFEITVLASSINNAVSEDIDVYPNPTTGMLNINFENTQNREIEIVNLTGQTIKQINSENEKIELDLSDLAKGTYFVRIRAEENVSIIKINVTE